MSYFELGLLHRAKKRRQKAKKCITKAIEVFKECKAETYLKRAREALASIDRS